MSMEEILQLAREHAARQRAEGVEGLDEHIRPGVWAEIIPDLDEESVATLMAWLPADERSDVMSELEPSHAADVLEDLSHDDAATIVEGMDPDDAADVVSELPEHLQASVLEHMEPEEAQELRELLAYPEDTAGGMMTPEFVAVSPEIRADQAISALRVVAEDTSTMYYVYVLDRDGLLLGVLPLHQLVLTKPDTPVADLMIRDPLRVHADADREIAARMLNDHNLLAIPVVDDTNHLLGIITQDDVSDIIEEETTEDFERMGGSEALDVPYWRASVVHLYKKRVRWLLMLFLAEMYTGTVLRHYEHILSEAVALSFFIPLLIGTGGNTGTQITTTLTRSMGIGEVKFNHAFRVIRKELMVGVLLGITMGTAAWIRAQTLHVGMDVGLVVAFTALAIVVWASFIAAFLPLVIRRLGMDPAVVSGPMIATVVDGTGLVIYFTIAHLILHVAN